MMVKKGRARNRWDGELIGALWNGDAAGMEKALAQGACVDAKLEGGLPSLEWAVRHGEPSCVKVLVEGGADAGQAFCTGEPALMVAASRGKLKVLRMLLKAGAGVDARDRRGRTALMHAVEWENEAGVEALLGAGADLDAKNVAGRSARDLCNAGSKCWRMMEAERAERAEREAPALEEEVGNAGRAVRKATL